MVCYGTVKTFFEMFAMERENKGGIIPYYQQFSVRMYEYDKYLVSHMSRKGYLNAILLSGESELMIPNDVMDDLLFPFV